MPLERASGVPYAELDGIYFPMKDTETGERVSCSVSYEYLQARMGVAEQTQDTRLSFFETLREEIEDIASGKYDAKQPCHVAAGD